MRKGLGRLTIDDGTVYVFDTTLRDGEQTPGVSLTVDEKVEIARQLDKLGVDVIEAGFPVVSGGELEGVKGIVSLKPNARVAVLARTNRKDMDTALSIGVDRVHVFIATSDIHLKYKLKIDREEALMKAVEAVEYLKSHGVEVEFSAEDATRTDPSFLREVFTEVAKADVDVIDIPDTVGVATPERMKELVELTRKAAPGKLISVHCHNDFGLAVANSIASVLAGANQFHGTINGIGERAGNAALEEVVMALRILYGKRFRIRSEFVYETSRLVAKLTGLYPQPNKAIVGENAFSHESGIHVHGVIEMPSTYEPMTPETVGRQRWLVAGKHAGTHGVEAMLKEYGITVTREQLKVILHEVKKLGDMGKKVTDADLLAIARSVTGRIPTEEARVRLKDFIVVTGKNVNPTASITMIIDDKEGKTSSIGVGPVDAAIKAIQQVTSELVDARLSEYRLEAITGGSDALGEVIIKVQDSMGNMASARATGPDIVVASVEALIDGMNKLLLKKAIKANMRMMDDV